MQKISDAIQGDGHICLFYRSKEDLLEVLVPYFNTGLDNHEFCLWITSEVIGVDAAREAMKQGRSGFDYCLQRGQMEFIPHTAWFLKNGRLNLRRASRTVEEKLKQALSGGFKGLRLSGDAACLENAYGKAFTGFKEGAGRAIGRRAIEALCTYRLDRLTTFETITVVSNHRAALMKQNDRWSRIENTPHKQPEPKTVTTEMNCGSMIEHAGDPIWVMDADGNVTYFNKRCKEINGMSFTDRCDRSYASLVVEEDLPRVKRMLHRTLNGAPQSFEARLKKGSDVVVLAVNSAPIYDGGKIVGAICFGRDIAKHVKVRKELEAKNAALREVLNQLEVEKKIIQYNVKTNIERLILPTLETLTYKGAYSQQLNLLRRNLEEIVSSFGVKISEQRLTLSPKEIEICNMIKGGYGNKEIAATLNISVQTIEKHRKNIRSKLDIVHKKINLSTYLRHL